MFIKILFKMLLSNGVYSFTLSTVYIYIYIYIYIYYYYFFLPKQGQMICFVMCK